MIAAPFMNQIPFAPVTRFRQNTSVLPSPLKSPTPTTCQFKSGTVPARLPEGVAPFISHTTTSPVDEFHQKMSDLPSLLTSPTPTICQFNGTVATVAEVKIVATFEN